VTSTGARFLAWVRRRALLLVATGATVAFVAVMVAGTLKVYDERRARLAAVEALAGENQRLAEANAEQDRQQCEGINATNGTVRFILDAGLRLRSPDNPIGDGLRAAYVDAYRRLPRTDCDTGAKTFFDPPFPERTTP
jgi:hypothetical protein